MPPSSSQGRRGASAPQPLYPRLGQLTAALCVLDILVTTVLFFCVPDWWQSQVRRS